MTRSWWSDHPWVRGGATLPAGLLAVATLLACGGAAEGAGWNARAAREGAGTFVDVAREAGIGNTHKPDLDPEAGNIMNWPASVGAAAAVPGSRAGAAKDDPGQILRRAEEFRSPDLDYAVELTLHTVNPASAWKERTSRYTLLAHGKDYSLVLMREPKQFHPGTLLIMRGLYWMLLPRSDKPIQLSEQQVLEGDVSHGDLARGNLLRAYEPRLDGEETIRGDACRRLELTRRSYEAFYPRIRCWVTRKKSQPRKLEYYGRTGTLLKTVYYEDYRKGALGLRPMRIEVESQAQKGETTTMTFSNIRPLDTSRLRFDVPGLIAFRNAALELFEANARQAQPEEILSRIAGTGPQGAAAVSPPAVSAASGKD